MIWRADDRVISFLNLVLLLLRPRAMFVRRQMGGAGTGNIIAGLQSSFLLTGGGLPVLVCAAGVAARLSASRGWVRRPRVVVVVVG